MEMTYLDAVYEAMSVSHQGNNVETCSVSIQSNSTVCVDSGSELFKADHRQSQNDEERLLERLLELEELLSKDQARKAKHQKPDLQMEWQQEIVRINAMLELN